MTPSEPRHEGYLIPGGKVLLAGLALLVAVVLVVIGMYGLYRNRTPEDTQPGEETEMAISVHPDMKNVSLEARQPEQLQQYKQEQQELLESYGWTDDAKTKARIPVDRAISILAERGLPVRETDEEEK